MLPVNLAVFNILLDNCGLCSDKLLELTLG